MVMWKYLVGPDGVFCLFSHYHILSTLRPHYPACMQLQYNNLTHTHSPQRRGDDGPTSRVAECSPYILRGQVRKVLALPPTTNPSSALTDIHGLQLNLVRLWCHLSSLSLPPHPSAACSRNMGPTRSKKCSYWKKKISCCSWSFL